MRHLKQFVVLAAVVVGWGCTNPIPGNRVQDTGADTTATPIDTGFPDTLVVDTGGNDTGAADTGQLDSGMADTGLTDTAVIWTEGIDTGTADTGTADTGTADTGTDVADTGMPDVMPACPTPTTRCGTACVNTASDFANCGTCGRACTGVEICAAGSCRAPRLNHVWSHCYGNGETWGGLAVDSAGNLYAGGNFQGTIDFGRGPRTSGAHMAGFATSIDPTRMERWTRVVTASSNFGYDALAASPSGASCMTGSFTDSVDFGDGPRTDPGSGNVYVTCTDPVGGFQWVQTAGDAGNQVGLDVAIDRSGSVILTGYFQWGSLVFSDGTRTPVGSTSPDVFLAKYDSSGTLLWSRSYGNSGYDVGYAVTADAEGNVYLAGKITGTWSMGGACSPMTGSSDSNNPSMFIASLTPTGTCRWSRALGGAGGSSISGMRTDSLGNLVIAGNLNGTADFGDRVIHTGSGSDIFLASYTTAGSLNWVRQAGGAGDDAVNGVAVDVEGNVYLTGWFQYSVNLGGSALASAGALDIFVASYSPTNVHRWSRSFGSGGEDRGGGIAVDSTGGVYLSAMQGGSIDFGGGALPAGCSLVFARFTQ